MTADNGTHPGIHPDDEITRLHDLEDRVALVTGAGQGVGRQIVLDLAAAGARAVIVNDLEAERAEDVAEQARALGTPATAVRADVTDFGDVAAMVARARDEHGPVGVLVNNAGNQGSAGGAPQRTPFWEQTPAQWQQAIGVNLHGVLNCSRHALAQMVEAGRGGRIVTVISDAGRVGEIHGLEAYSAAKAGAAGVTRSLARLGGRHGVTANCVALGGTRTPATAELLDDPETARKVFASYMLRRPGEPTDGSGLVVVLASRAGAWVTGQTIPVNGGYSVTL